MKEKKMSKLYELNVSINFIGNVKVKANNKKIAKEIAEKYFNGIIEQCFNGGNENIIDWDMSMHSEETKVRR